MNYKNISFSQEESESLRVLLEKAEGMPIQYTEGIREIWYRGENSEMELRIIFLFDIKLTISRVCFTKQRQGTMTKVMAFLREFCLKNQIQEIVVQSVETREMAAWCLKNGLVPDLYSSFLLQDSFMGDYYCYPNYSLPAQYDFNWIVNKLNYLRPMIRRYWESADYENIPFEHDSVIHEKSHCKRVLILSVLLGFLQAVSKEALDSLATAAIYHDVGRLSDMEERVHGQISAKKYECAMLDPDPMAVFLMTYHSRDDKEGEEAASQMEDPTLARSLLQIFKDADALDRIRFGKRDLNPNFLRTNESKKLIFASVYLFRL